MCEDTEAYKPNTWGTLFQCNFSNNKNSPKINEVEIIIRLLLRLLINFYFINNMEKIL